MKTIWQIYLFIILLVGCSNNSTKKDIGQGIDLSSNGKYILLTYTNNGEKGIYEYSLEDYKLKQLTNSKDAFHVRPRYSPDNKSIVFMEYPNRDYNSCNVIILNKSTKETTTILKGELNITEAIFSNDGNNIYYIQATSIGKIPNGNDIYKLNLSGNEKSKLTNFNSYSLGNLKVLNDSLLLVDAIGEGIVKGMGMINTYTGEFIPITTENDPRNNVSDAYTPIAYKNYTILYYAPYQIYQYNLQNKKCDLVLDRRGRDQMYSICIDSNWQRLVFTEDANLYLYNLENKNLRLINIIGN